EGYFADLALVDLNQSTAVKKENILYKCGWSPFEEKIFSAAIIKTFVNGNCVYNEDNYGKQLFNESIKGGRLSFKG
ncbi:MAG: dihydroorotase, partial [Ginsengibacter sp.]